MLGISLFCVMMFCECIIVVHIGNACVLNVYMDVFIQVVCTGTGINRTV